MNPSVAAPLQPILDLFSGNPWLQGSTVILLTFVAASLFTWVIFFIVDKITRKTPIEFDNQVVAILRPPVYYTLLATGVSAGLAIMPISARLFDILTKSFKTAGVVLWTVFCIRLALLLLDRIAALSDRFSLIQRRTLTLFDNGAKIIIFAIGAYLIFVIWNIDMTAWLASAGIIGIAVGFAAKDTLANLFSGVFIVADAPYKLGDYVVLESGERGKVIQIGLRSTRLLTRDDVEITIPNSIMGNSKIINQSGGPSEKFRLRIKVGVAYGSDIDQVRTILLDIARSESLVCTYPAPRVRFRLFGPSSLDFELLCWTHNPALKGRTTDRLNDAIYKAFQKAAIEIPYSKQDIYIRQLPDNCPHEIRNGNLDDNVAFSGSRSEDR